MRLKNHYWILRHGQARSNQQRFVSSWPERVYNPLTKKGKNQIKAVIPSLKKKDITMIFSSDLTRTKQTAEMVSRALGLRIKFDQRLREIGMGIYNGRDEKLWNDFFQTNTQRFFKRPLGGENYRDVKKRVTAFIKEIDKKYQGENILLISHGCILFSLQAAVKGFTEKQERKYRQRLVMKTGQLRELKP